MPARVSADDAAQLGAGCLSPVEPHDHEIGTLFFERLPEARQISANIEAAIDPDNGLAQRLGEGLVDIESEDRGLSGPPPLQRLNEEGDHLTRALGSGKHARDPGSSEFHAILDFLAVREYKNQCGTGELCDTVEQFPARP